MDTNIDARWFEKYQEIEDIQITDFLVGDPKKRKKAKAIFLSGDSDAPALEYPKLETLGVPSIEQQLNTLRREIVEQETNQAVVLAYQQLIDEKLLHLQLLEAAKTQNDHLFKQKTEEAFGVPRPKLLSRLVPHLQSMVLQAKESSFDLSVSIQAVEAVIKGLEADQQNAIAPVFKLKEIEDIGADQIFDRLSKALEEYGVRGWRIEMDEESVNPFVNINSAKKEIRIPRARKISKQHLEALVVHEIGVHARRSQHAEKTKFQLLTIGLDHYLKGDEGLSKYEEFKVFPQSFNSTIEIYLGISLIYGLGGLPRGFREIFDFFKHYHVVSNFDRVITIDQANDYAWTRAEKFFRGTTGLSKGICFTKDLLYLEGYLGILDVLQHHPEEERRFFVGKYDPANESHRRILDAFFISPTAFGK